MKKMEEEIMDEKKKQVRVERPFSWAGAVTALGFFGMVVAIVWIVAEAITG